MAERTPRCPYCENNSVLTDSAEVYGGRSYGPIYLCRPCNAYVGVHRGTTIPLGRLANSELREAKRKAHAAFDPIWKGKAMSRSKAYRWLANQLGIAKSRCHIGLMSLEECQRTIEVCREWKAVARG